jgi:uncharacterized protein
VADAAEASTDVVDALPRLGVSDQVITAFCRKWGVVELSLFGSALREDFRPDSDVDVMVRFAEGGGPSAFGLVDMALELEALFGRPVDLVEDGTIENPYRRRDIMRERAVLYAT